MSKTEIALQIYTLREFTKTPGDFAQTIEKIGRIGYKAIELAGLWDQDNSLMKDTLQKNGVSAISAHVGMNNLKESLPATFERMKTLGFRHAALAHVGPEYRTEDGIRQLVTELSEIGKKFADQGYSLYYHNHKFEFQKFSGRTMLDILFEDVDKKYLNPQLDLCWVHNGGMNPADAVKKYKNRFFTLHFKEYTIKDDQVTLCELGQGMFNWKEIIKAGRDAGARWFIVEQDKCERDPFESVRMSIEYLNSLGVK